MFALVSESLLVLGPGHDQWRDQAWLALLQMPRPAVAFMFKGPRAAAARLLPPRRLNLHRWGPYETPPLGLALLAIGRERGKKKTQNPEHGGVNNGDVVVVGDGGLVGRVVNLVHGFFSSAVPSAASTASLSNLAGTHTRGCPLA